MFLIYHGVHTVFYKLGEILARELTWMGKSYELNLLPFFDFADLDCSDE